MVMRHRFVPFGFAQVHLMGALRSPPAAPEHVLRKDHSALWWLGAELRG